MSDSTLEDIREEFARLTSGIDMSSTAQNKFNILVDWLSATFSAEAGATYISKSKMISNRVVQSGVRRANLVFVFLGQENLLGPVVRHQLVRAHFASGDWEVMALCKLAKDQWKVDAIVAPHGGHLATELKEAFSDAVMVPIDLSDLSAPASPSRYAPEIPLVSDHRIKRMIKLAIMSAPAVMLVGPPGTGKTTMLTQIANEIEEDPESYGFTRSWPIKRVTPEESWTTRDLVGGETVDEKGALRYRPGHVLSAIRDQQWLMLDEANRADMDRIFGGLLTWLTGHSVELGRASSALDAPVVELGWQSEPGNLIEGEDQLVADRPKGTARQPVRFLAGNEWRLLGTYNALDAQRVFRFGQALGRRFVRVPVPILTDEEFKTALRPMLVGLPDEVARRVQGLYRAHAQGAHTKLGPALFFWLPEYVRAGLNAPLREFDVTELAEPQPSPDVLAAHTSTAISSLLAEAYLASIGSWLAKLDDQDLDSLLAQIIGEDTLPESEVQWLRNLLPALG